MSPETRLVRQITVKLIPFLILLYLIAYIDRSAVGFAKLSMGADIGLGDAAYGMGAGLFFIGYFLFEIPSNLMLDRFGARRWFARILFTWGLMTMGMAFIDSAGGFYVMRFLLGAAEAGFFPGVLYYITQWYPVRHRGKVLGLFILSQPIAMLITGPLSGLLLGLDGLTGLHGWQWLFLAIGAPAVLLAWPTLRILPDRPDQVDWLSGEQKTWLLGELEKDRQDYGQTHHENPLHTLKDKRVLLLALFFLPVTLSIYGLGLWLPTIVHQFGGSTLATGFIAAVPYVFGILGLLVVPRSSDRLNDRYGHLAVLHALGACAMFFSAWLGSPVLQLAALSLVAFSLYSITAVFWTLPGRFFSGASAAAGIALINSFGNLGGYLGPFAIGALKEHTGNLASGLYFLSAVLCFGLLLTGIVYQRLERRQAQQPAHLGGV
ncbi:major facilitator family transporter [Azotobacter vinelandii CA]|uniref:Major facilitator family transporter n=2 Tax=Azotobacter vinelandii TaxID=354 RepID=C1DL30_AZOVD|nr:MFS transporter [Azotobacter vinelandii]ACO81023.1 major facilitator family transporter [Azotobacter vinelandii DJ]AGK14199.1 major facilitator family transporter [Azotobacter vinelandii CA]AGK22303.1 major facilitator family transporter [Azotobacter vinelandii CA6]SFW98212.1 Sugar phosphate permease [Azotobacter vinelandii]GLK60502.1 MFS transporter [Azotobacter vinelandii]